MTRNGEATEVELNPDLSQFSLRETVRLEEALGEQLFDRLMGSAGDGGKVEVPSSPRIIQAIIWCKLASVYPEIGLNDFDLDLSQLMDETTDSVVIPMQLPDGTEVQGEVATGTGGKG